MSQPTTRAVVRISDWPGLVSNLGPDAPPDQPGAAAVQVNLACLRQGLIEVRPGTKPIRYDAEAGDPGPTSMTWDEGSTLAWDTGYELGWG